MTQLAIDHLWQSTLFAVLVGFLTLAFRANSARVRFSLWFASSLKFLVPFTLISDVGAHVRWITVPSIPIDEAWSGLLGDIIAPGTLIAPGQGVPPSLATAPTDSGWNFVSLIWLAWACGVGVVLLCRMLQWLRLRALVRASRPMPLAAPVEILAAPALLEPGLIGVFRPVLLLPSDIADHLTPEQLNLVLSHELCHFRRRDNLTATIHMVVEALFWFHPLVWWIEQHLIVEREQACDESVLAAHADPQAYAESILAVCRFYMRSPRFSASSVSSGNLKARVERIIRNRAPYELGRPKAATLAILTAAALLAPFVLGFLTTSDTVAIAALPEQITGGEAGRSPPPAEPPEQPSALPSFAAPDAVTPGNDDTSKRADKHAAPGQDRKERRASGDKQRSVPGPCLVDLSSCSREVVPCLLDDKPCDQKPVAVLIEAAPATLHSAGAAPAQELSNGPDKSKQAVSGLSPDAQVLLVHGKDSFSEKKYDQAVAAFSKVIQLAPADADAFLLRAGAYFAKKKYDNAIADFSAVIRLQPTNAIALNDRGFAYFTKEVSEPAPFVWKSDTVSRQRLQPALADYDEAIRIKPDLARAYWNRAMAYAEITQSENGNVAYKQAEADLREALQLTSETGVPKSLVAKAEDQLQALRYGSSQALSAIPGPPQMGTPAYVAPTSLAASSSAMPPHK